MRPVLLRVLSLTVFAALCAQCDEFDSACLSYDATCDSGVWTLLSPSALGLATNSAANGAASTATNADQGARNCSGVTAGTPYYTFLGSAATLALVLTTCATADGGVIWAGNSTQNIATLGGQTPRITFTAGTDALVVKHSPAGAVEWYTFLGGGLGIDDAKSITQTLDGGYLVAGVVTADIATLGGLTPIFPHTGGQDGVLFKLSATGVLEWYGFIGSGGGGDSLNRIHLAPDGSILVAGAVAADVPTFAGRTPLNAHGGGLDGIVLNFTATGAVNWYTMLGSGATEIIQGLGVTPGGAICVLIQSDTAVATLAGRTPVNAGAVGDNFLTAQLNSSGAVNWYTLAGSNAATDIPRDGGATPTGGCVITGSADAAIATLDGRTPLVAHSGSTYDAVTIRYDANGLTQWYTYAGTTGVDDSFALAVAGDDSVYVAAGTNGAIGSLGGQTPVRAYTGSTESMLIHYTAAGAVQWFTFAGSASGDGLRALSLAADGGVYAGGFATANIATLGSQTPLLPFVGAQAATLIRYNASGDL